MCWGRSQDGRAHIPESLKQTPFLSVDVGGDHNCGIHIDNTVSCWHYNGSLGPHPEPRQTRFLTVAAGGVHACGIKTDHTASCWGDTRHGQSPIPDDLKQTIFLDVVSGFNHSCGIRINGLITCWGDKEKEQTTLPTNQVKPGS